VTFFERFVTRAFPNAHVERLDYRDAYRVWMDVDAKTLAGDREQALSALYGALKPKFTKPRRLHWGKKH
jgi:hypothetical protein